jgi:hypothetical protein
LERKGTSKMKMMACQIIRPVPGVSNSISSSDKFQLLVLKRAPANCRILFLVFLDSIKVPPKGK